MLKQRSFVINYILNNQPESIDVQTDAEIISDEDAKNFIYETKNFDQPANITDIRIFQHAVDANLDPTGSDVEDDVTTEDRHDQN